MIDLNWEDTDDLELPALLTDSLSNEDLVDSQNQCISVQYNEIDLGMSEYGFNQPFEGNEANLYFMVGRNGMIHILFFDPYHEINP